MTFALCCPLFGASSPAAAHVIPPDADASATAAAEPAMNVRRVTDGVASLSCIANPFLEYARM
jgi:hypothetical protein